MANFRVKDSSGAEHRICADQVDDKNSECLTFYNLDQNLSKDKIAVFFKPIWYKKLKEEV